MPDWESPLSDGWSMMMDVDKHKQVRVEDFLCGQRQYPMAVEIEMGQKFSNVEVEWLEFCSPTSNVVDVCSAWQFTYSQWSGHFFLYLTSSLWNRLSRTRFKLFPPNLSPSK